MVSDTAAAPQPHFRFKFLPVLAVVALALGLPWLAYEMVDFARHYSHEYVPAMADKLPFSYATHGVLLIVTLIVIAVMKLPVRADYGLHPPRGKSYLGWALISGVVLGAAIAGLHYAALLGTPFGNQQAARLDAVGTLGAADIGRRLLDQGVFVSLSEEVLFRALLVTFLIATMPGNWRIAGYEVSVAGLIVALVYALCAMTVFPLAWATAAYVLVLLVQGVLFAHWLERSKSIAAPVVGHSVAAMVGYLGLVAITQAA
jgi:uncharacterized protein